MAWPPATHADVQTEVGNLRNAPHVGGSPASGTPTASTFLRGDGAWAVPSGGSGSAVTGGVNVKDYGAVGNGMTNDLVAFQNAVNASRLVHVPPGEYILAGTLTLPAGTMLRGGGRYNTILIKNFNGDQCVMNTESALVDIRLEGAGSTYTGRGVVIPAASGRQEMRGVAITNPQGYCIDFEAIDSGSQFRAIQLDLRRQNAASGSGLYQVRVNPGQQLSAVPRTFMEVECNGQASFDFGGCNNFHIVGSTIGDLNFTAETRGLDITACRWNNQSSVTVRGHGINIVANSISPSITIAPGSTWVSIVANNTNGTVTNSSGNSSCLVLNGTP